MIDAYHSVRRELERALGSRVEEPEWERLVRDRWIYDVLKGDETTLSVVDHIRDQRATWGRPGPVQEPKLAMRPREARVRPSCAPATRGEIVSELLAQEAARDPLVGAFRASVLGDSLMRQDEVEDWIARQAKLQGPPTTYLDRVPVPSGSQIAVDREAGGIGVSPPIEIGTTRPVPARVSTRRLEYGAIGSGQWVRRVPVAATGPLAELKSVSEHLAEQFGWQEAQASVFVLTGDIPVVYPMRARVRHLSPYTAASRIELSVDPAITPRELANYYRMLRSTLLGRRHRTLSEKHLRLAAFVANRPAGDTWGDTMRAWNVVHAGRPKWPYQHASNFQRDAMRAQQRLLYPNYAGT